MFRRRFHSLTLYQTVILDCCHSGSGTRHVEKRQMSRLERGFDLEADIIPSTLDDVIWNKLPKDRESVSAAGSKSHVLLAACRESEVAFETDGHGAFTRALLDTLRTIPTDTVTYQDLIRRLPAIREFVISLIDIGATGAHIP